MQVHSQNLKWRIQTLLASSKALIYWLILVEEWLQHYYSFFASSKLKLQPKLVKDTDMASFSNTPLNPSTKIHYWLVLPNVLVATMNTVFQTIHLIFQGWILKSPSMTKINRKILAFELSLGLNNLKDSFLFHGTFSWFLAVA